MADAVFAQIEESILNGVLSSGELLTENKLCEMLSVSRTPVREALKRLQQEGLIEETCKVAVVVVITEKDLYDIYEVRLRVEGLCTALCADSITDEQLTELEETVALQEFYTSRGQADSIKNLDSRFHEQIYSYCGSKILSSLLTELHRKVQRFRLASVEDPTRAAAAVAEHREILNALRERDRAKAEKLSVSHIENARAAVTRSNQNSTSLSAKGE